MRVSGFRLRTGSVVAAGPSTPFVTKNDWPPDQKQLSYAVENDWILVTFDDDLLSLVGGTGLEHTGVVYVQQAGRDIGDVVKATARTSNHVLKTTAISTTADWPRYGRPRDLYTIAAAKGK